MLTKKASIVFQKKERALLACLPCQNKGHCALSLAKDLSEKGGTAMPCCFKRAAFTCPVLKHILSQFGDFLRAQTLAPRTLT
jgi:hypothetical protein